MTDEQITLNFHWGPADGIVATWDEASSDWLLADEWGPWRAENDDSKPLLIEQPDPDTTLVTIRGIVHQYRHEYGTIWRHTPLAGSTTGTDDVPSGL